LRRTPLAAVYLTVFIDLLGFSIILPLLPFYAERYGATGVWVGALLTAYSAVQFVSAPILGRLSDRIGRRPVLLLSLAGSALSLALTGVAHSLWLLLAGRALAGLFGGSIATAQAYVADVTPAEERARYMGLLGASVGLGFVFGPAVGAAFSPLGFGAAAFFAAGLATANFVLTYLRVPESRTPASPLAGRRPSRTGIVAAFGRPAVARIVVAMFLTTFAFVGLEATFALFSQRRFGLGARGFGLAFTYVGIVVVVVQGGLVGRLNARYGERMLAAGGAALMGLGLLGVAFAPDLALGMLMLTVLALGQGLANPALSSLLSRESHADEQGSTLGVGQSMTAAARASGPLLAGLLYDAQFALPYVAGALLALGVVWLLSQTTVAAEAEPTPVPQDTTVG
jgi:DHA1 family tetracycline resistance protein-like MFS transporter